MGLHRARGEEQPLRDRRVGQSAIHQEQHVELPAGHARRSERGRHNRVSPAASGRQPGPAQQVAADPGQQGAHPPARARARSARSNGTGSPQPSAIAASSVNSRRKRRHHPTGASSASPAANACSAVARSAPPGRRRWHRRTAARRASARRSTHGRAAHYRPRPLAPVRPSAPRPPARGRSGTSAPSSRARQTGRAASSSSTLAAARSWPSQRRHGPNGRHQDCGCPGGIPLEVVQLGQPLLHRRRSRPSARPGSPASARSTKANAGKPQHGRAPVKRRRRVRQRRGTVGEKSPSASRISAWPSLPSSPTWPARRAPRAARVTARRPAARACPARTAPRPATGQTVLAGELCRRGEGIPGCGGLPSRRIRPVHAQRPRSANRPAAPAGRGSPPGRPARRPRPPDRRRGRRRRSSISDRASSVVRPGQPTRPPVPTARPSTAAAASCRHSSACSSWRAASRAPFADLEGPPPGRPAVQQLHRSRATSTGRPEPSGSAQPLLRAVQTALVQRPAGSAGPAPRPPGRSHRRGPAAQRPRCPRHRCPDRAAARPHGG